MRIVLDTNVVVWALLWRGTPYQLLHVIRHHANVQLFTSTPLLEELADVSPSASNSEAVNSDLGERLRKHWQITSKRSRSHSERCHSRSLTMLLSSRVHWRQKLILIVSGDKDLLTLGSYRAIAIVNPTTAIERLMQAS